MLCNTEGYLKNRSGKKKSWLQGFSEPAQWVLHPTLTSTGGTDGDGGVGNSGVR
jgi:hypothetical protein